MRDEQAHKTLKKRLGEGIIIAAAEGVILAVCDKNEYEISKRIKGFVWQMPICLSVRAQGSGNYDEYINKYMNKEEAYYLLYQLNRCLRHLENPSERLLEKLRVRLIYRRKFHAR